LAAHPRRSWRPMLERLEDRMAPALSGSNLYGAVASSAPASPMPSQAADPADLALTMSGPGGATAGTSITYTPPPSHNGPATAPAVALPDALPAGETLLAESQLSGPDTFTNTSSGNTASFSTIATPFPFSGAGTSGTISIPPGSVPWSVQNDIINPAQD